MIYSPRETGMGDCAWILRYKLNWKTSFWREVQSGETTAIFGSLVFILSHKKTKQTGRVLDGTL